MKLKIFIGIVIFQFAAIAIAAQTTEFSYQGSLKDGANQATGNYDFEFRLFDALAAGGQIGPLLTRNVAVANGTFAVKLDFGNFFNGADRFLEIRVRNVGGSGYTVLDPRQRVGSSPYAIKSLLAETANTANSATTATNATNLGGVAASQYVVTTDPRMTNARAPTAGSANYVQNTVNLQAGGNFNIAGSGTVGGTLSGGIVNAVTQFDIGGSRVLSTAGSLNTFVGINTGIVNTGSINAFFGTAAGKANSTGGSNAFFGSLAGEKNTTGGSNSFFGRSAGNANTTGGLNSFFGSLSGDANTIGERNSFFGRSSGGANIGGSDNSFFGYTAGVLNTSGVSNAFFGAGAGSANTQGFSNSFFGADAGLNNTTGSHNTLVGDGANVVSSSLNFATAIGANSRASESNSVYLGRPTGQDTVRIPGALVVTENTELNGTLSVAFLGLGGSRDICRNDSDVISLCSSSLRYKTNVHRSSLGLSLVNQLKPVTFDWIDGGMHDLGLGAEDVAAIEPLLVTYKDGAVEGVKYDRIGVVLINAVKEQQAQIEKLAEQNRRQQLVIESLVRSMCKQNASDAVCKELK